MTRACHVRRCASCVPRSTCAHDTTPAQRASPHFVPGSVRGASRERASHSRGRHGTWKDFVDLVYKVQDEYCACVATACLVAREERTVSVVLGDVYTVHGTVLPDELSHLRINGPLIIAQLTKNQGILWCQMVAHFLYCCALNAAATYVDVVSDVRNGGFDDQSLTDGMIRTMHKEVRRSFC